MTLSECRPSPRKREHPDMSKEDVLQSILQELNEMKTVMRRYQKLCFKYCISIALLDSLEKSLECCICETSPSNSCIIVRKKSKTLVACNDCTKELLKIFSEVIAASKCGPLAMSLKLDLLASFSKMREALV